MRFMNHSHNSPINFERELSLSIDGSYNMNFGHLKFKNEN